MGDNFPIRVPDKLPRKIERCPIVETLFELRFQSGVPSQAVLGLVYHKVRAEFPRLITLPLASTPEEAIQANPMLRYQGHYRLEGEKFVLIVGPCSISVAMKGIYPGWAVIFPKFTHVLGQLLETELVNMPERFGLRYINFFPADILHRLDLSFSIQDHLVKGSETFFKTILDWNYLKTMLQVGKDLNVTSTTLPQPSVGSIIDIDCFSIPNPDIAMQTDVRKFLEIAHTTEKQLFFGLLKPDFLAEFNPEY